MDSFELNKIAGAVLFSLLIVMTLGVTSDMIFHSEAPETPGYEIAVAEDAGAGAEAAAPEAVASIGERLASADAAAGEKVAKKCVACHTFDNGGANKVGPNLWDVVGRQPGGHEGFKYSAAMIEYGQTHPAWTFEELDDFIRKPKEHVPGTSMGFAGLGKPEDRADLLAYLRTLSDSPAPLPAATAAAETPAAEAPAADAPAEAPAADAPAAAEAPAAEQPASEAEQDPTPAQ